MNSCATILTSECDLHRRPLALRRPRILIVRLSAIGDVIHGLPALCALRRALPAAYIGWVVEGRSADLLEGHPALDELIRVRRGWLTSPREVWRLRKQLRELRFNTTIDLQCLTKSAIAAWLSGAPRRIGKAGAHGRELSRWFHNQLVAVGGSHVIEHYLQLLRPLGIESPHVDFGLPERATDGRASDEFLRGAGLSAGQFAIVNPGAGWPSKQWPAERYGALANYLYSAHKLPSVAVWAGDAENAHWRIRLSRQAAKRHVVRRQQRWPSWLPFRGGRRYLSAAIRARCIWPSPSARPPSVCTVPAGPNGAERMGSAIFACKCVMKMARRSSGGADDSAMRAIGVEMVAAACERILASRDVRQCG